MRKQLVRALAITLGLVATTSVLTAPAWGGEDKGLCGTKAPSHTRVTIPGKFPLAACFDGSTLVVKNNTEFPLSLTFIGDDVGNPRRYTMGGEGAARVLEFIQPGPFARQPQINAPYYRSGLVPPKYYVSAPIGNGKAEVRVEIASTTVQRQYMVAKLLWDHMPAGAAAEVGKALAELSRELTDIGDQHLNCLNRNGAWGDIGCTALLGRNIVFAYGRSAINGLGKGAIKAVTSLLGTAKWADAAARDRTAIMQGTNSFTIAAHVEPAKPTTKAPDPVPNPQPNPTNGGGGGNPPPPPTYIATVQNMHLNGPTALAEDSTPAYLSTRTQPFCTRDGCKIGGTDMWTGANFVALCWAHGAEMTNENRNISFDDNNPHRIDTTKWMRGRVNGHTGWISFIYINPASRGLPVPNC